MLQTVAVAWHRTTSVGPIESIAGEGLPISRSVALPRRLVRRSWIDTERDSRDGGLGSARGFYRGARYPAHIQALAHIEGLPAQLDGEPVDVAGAFDEYGAWLSPRPIPKLLITGDPGQTAKRVLDFARGWPNNREVTVKERRNGARPIRRRDAGGQTWSRRRPKKSSDQGQRIPVVGPSTLAVSASTGV